MMHTPGPWQVRQPRNKHDVSVCEYEVIAKHGDREIKVCNIHNGLRANAKLIELAPQMLEELRLVVDVFGSMERREPKAEAVLLMSIVDTIKQASGEDV